MSKVDSKLVTIAQMPGCLECRWTLDCQWCGAEVWEEAETEAEATAALVKKGVRQVHHEDTIYMMCPDCAELALKGQLDD